MARVSLHQLGVIGASLLLAGSAAWFGTAEARARAAARGAAKGKAAISSSAYTPVAHDAPVVKTETWPAPPAQRRGREWVYDVFTPPEIFYDERTKQFSITPPVLEPPKTEVAPAPFGFELVGVKRALFRLQLVGYVGGEGSYRGLFENALTTETFLATGARSLPALNLTIEEFEVRRQPVSLPESTTIARPVATAIVRDERTGEKITLTSAERFYADAPVATVTLGGGAPREVHEGDRIDGEGAVFRVDKIQLAPAAVDVTKVTSDQLSEQRTLTVPSDASAANPPPRA